MNLNQIRNAVVKLSGRYDLLSDDPDKTIDAFINGGSEYLDRLSEVQKSYATHYRYLAIGGWNIQVPYCRAVKEVWISDTASRWQLEKKPLQELLAGLMTEKVSLLEQGDPLYYAPMLTRTVGTPPVGIASYIDTIVSQGHFYNAILILSPPDQQLLVEIKGLFNQDKLSDENDENFWSVVHPLLLIKATLREIEDFNQDAAKATALENSIVKTLDGINKDMVEEDIAEVDEMGDVSGWEDGLND